MARSANIMHACGRGIMPADKVPVRAKREHILEESMDELYYQKALALKALADPNRLVILEQLMDGERCACKLLEQLRISQPTLSHHMKILHEAGLVCCRRDGKWMHYRLNRNKFMELGRLLENFAAGEDGLTNS